MGNIDYSSPIPLKNLELRFKNIFRILDKGQSATLLALPHTGKTSNLRYISKNWGKNIYLLDGNNIEQNIESFIFELIHLISGKFSSNYKDLFLLNKELLQLVEKNTKKEKIILVISLKEKLLPFSNDIDNLIVQCQKSSLKFPFSVLWSTDTKTFRNFKKVHPSSTFGENTIYFPTFDENETLHSLKRICLSKSLNKDVSKEFFDITGGIAGLFHSYINFGKNMWSDNLVQNILRDIKNEINILDEKIKDKLISQKALEIVNQNFQEKVNYKTIIFAANPTAQEINIINFLLEKNEPVSRDEIAKILWGKSWNSKYSDWAIDKVISRLRIKIADSGVSLLTIKNFGYQLFK